MLEFIFAKLFSLLRSETREGGGSGAKQKENNFT
jgi:hypothetical protein